MLSANRRSSLYRIALLCYAIVVSQTAHAAMAAQHLTPVAVPCAGKTVIAQPQPRRKLSVALKSGQPAVPSTQTTHFLTAFLLAQRTAIANPSSGSSYAYLVDAPVVASQLRPHVLRI